MRFYFREHAETEFDKAVDFYEDCRYGLGVEFAQEVYATIVRYIAPILHFLGVKQAIFMEWGTV